MSQKKFEDGLSGPKNGFGNQLYGVVQGAIVSYILGRQMILKWKFSEFFENTFDWVIEESVEKAIERGEMKGEGSFDSVFTLASMDLGSILHEISRVENLSPILIGSYRDKLCSMLSDHSQVRARRKFVNVLQFNKEEERYWLQEKTICVHVLSCLLKHLLSPSSVVINILDEIIRTFGEEHTEIIAMHVRLGDQEMLDSVPKSMKRIHSGWASNRFSSSEHAEVILKFAEGLKEKLQMEGKVVKIFLATDSEKFVIYAKQRLGKTLITTTEVGQIGHSAYGNYGSRLRSVIDFAFLSLANHTICGPWSSFVNLASVWGYLPHKRIYVCKKRLKSSGKIGSTRCRKSHLIDHWKGPKPS